MSVDKSVLSPTAGNHAGGIERKPLWIESGARRLWAWIHQADNGVSRGGAAVVLFNPLGHESIHAHRSIRRLADALAGAGFTVLRFDYAGTGDSEGDQLDDAIVGQWLLDARAVVEYLKVHCAADVVHMVGIRSGALIASACASDSNAGGGLVLWDACSSGKRFVRELKANSRLAYFRSAPDLLEAVGFPYSQAMMQDLAALDIAVSLHEFQRPLLLVTRSEGPDDRLSQALAGSSAAMTRVDAEGLEEMLVVPHQTRVPEAAIASVVEWFAGLPGNSKSCALAPPDDSASRLTLPDAAGEIVEYAVEIAPAGMFGLLCRPADDVALTKPIVLLGNAGSIYHVGPNRLYVMLARRLATAGFASIRYDLANIGDGMKHPHAEENFPYPSDAVERISDVINFVKQDLGFDRAILTGFCSGATQAFQAALAQSPESTLVEIIMVNPKTFYGGQAVRDGDNLVMRRSSYYSRAIRDPSRWRRLFAGDIDYRKLWAFVGGRAQFLLRESRRRLRALAGSDSGTRLGNDLQRYLRGGRRLSFFFSSRDPGFHVLIESSGGVARQLIDDGTIPVSTIDDADHTLIAKRCRDDFINRFVDYVSATYR